MPPVCTIGAGERLDRKVGLGIALLEDARAKVGFAIAVHVLAVDLRRHVQIVFPGDGRFQPGIRQNVGPVVDHLEIAIDHQKLGLATDLLTEFAEVGCDVVEVDLVVGGDIWVQVFQQAGCIQFDAPTGGEDPDIDRIGARRPVVLDLREDLGERHLGDDDLAARHLFEFLAALDKATGDDVTRPRQNIDGHPAEVLGKRGYGGAAESGGADRQRSEIVAKRHNESSQTVLSVAGILCPDGN